jgi:hypothetical protein
MVNFDQRKRKNLKGMLLLVTLVDLVSRQIRVIFAVVMEKEKCSFGIGKMEDYTRNLELTTR